jgi:alkylation response protein AidB-like acyl-CoA dehydrogenase
MTQPDALAELRESLRRLLDERSPLATVRAMMDHPDGLDVTLWSVMVEQAGLPALGIPERFGGAGFGLPELAVVFEEFGRSLACSAFFATIGLAANALLTCDDDTAQADLLPSIAAGERFATLAYAEPRSGWDWHGETTATLRDGAWTLTGAKAPVVEGARADLVLIVAEASAGTTLFGIDGDAPGLVREPLPVMDLTRRAARLRLEHVPARLIGQPGQAVPGLERALDRACVALAAESAGGARRCLEMAVDYARQRTQFGQVIGTLQAIKHKCASVLVEVEAAAATVQYVAGLAAGGSPELESAASLAKAFCADTYVRAAAENVQIHGGVGFTWEADPQLYLKRAKSSQLLLGTSDRHRARMMARLERRRSTRPPETTSLTR